jgi:hypothetical protein
VASNALSFLNAAAGAIGQRSLGFDLGSRAASLLNTARNGVNGTSGQANTHHLADVETALASMAQDDPTAAKAVRAAVMDALSPLEQGELLRLSCGASKRASVEMGPMEDAPSPKQAEAQNQISFGNIVPTGVKENPDASRTLYYFTKAQAEATPEAMRTAALSTIAIYNYEGGSLNGTRRNDVDASGQMKPIAGAQEELLADAAKDMGFPDSDTAKAMRTGYAALAADVSAHPQIREDAAQVVQLLDANTAAWDKYVLSDIKLNITAPAQIAYDARQRAITVFANDGLTRDLASFTVTALGGAAISIAAPAAGAAMAAKGTPLFYAATGATGGTLNVGLGEIARGITGEESTTGKRVGDFTAGMFVIVGVTQFALKFPITAGAASGGGGAGFGNAVEQGISKGHVNLPELAKQTTVGAIAGTVGAKFGKDLAVDGITSGRGNWMGSYQGGMTRMNNGNASGVTPAVSMKGGIAANVKAVPSTVIEAGVQTGIEEIVIREKPNQP